MSVEAEFRREAELAMHDDDGLLAAMKQLLEEAWAFLAEPGAARRRAPAQAPA